MGCGGVSEEEVAERVAEELAAREAEREEAAAREAEAERVQAEQEERAAQEEALREEEAAKERRAAEEMEWLRDFNGHVATRLNVLTVERSTRKVVDELTVLETTLQEASRVGEFLGDKDVVLGYITDVQIGILSQLKRTIVARGVMTDRLRDTILETSRVFRSTRDTLTDALGESATLHLWVGPLSEDLGRSDLPEIYR